MLTYVASIPLSTRTLVYLSDLIRARRREVGSRWRRLNPGRQELRMRSAAAQKGAR